MISRVSLLINIFALLNDTKVLIDLFQKVAQVEGAKPSSRLARREVPHRRFSFAKLFYLRLRCQREKRGKNLYNLTISVFFTGLCQRTNGAVACA